MWTCFLHYWNSIKKSQIGCQPTRTRIPFCNLHFERNKTKKHLFQDRSKGYSKLNMTQIVAINRILNSSESIVKRQIVMTYMILKYVTTWNLINIWQIFTVGTDADFCFVSICLYASTSRILEPSPQALISSSLKFEQMADEVIPWIALS